MLEHEYCTPVFIDNINDELDYDKENIEKGNDELLIDAIRGYPHLYNSSMKEYKDVQMKEKIHGGKLDYSRICQVKSSFFFTSIFMPVYIDLL